MTLLLSCRTRQPVCSVLKVICVLHAAGLLFQLFIMVSIVLVHLMLLHSAGHSIYNAGDFGAGSSPSLPIDNMPPVRQGYLHIHIASSSCYSFYTCMYNYIESLIAYPHATSPFLHQGWLSF